MLGTCSSVLPVLKRSNAGFDFAVRARLFVSGTRFNTALLRFTLPQASQAQIHPAAAAGGIGVLCEAEKPRGAAPRPTQGSPPEQVPGAASGAGGTPQPLPGNTTLASKQAWERHLREVERVRAAREAREGLRPVGMLSGPRSEGELQWQQHLRRVGESPTRLRQSWEGIPRARHAHGDEPRPHSARAAGGEARDDARGGHGDTSRPYTTAGNDGPDRSKGVDTRAMEDMTREC